MKPVDLLIETGQILYGESWISPLAVELGVQRETVRQWRVERMQFPYTHPLFWRLTDLIDTRRMELEDQLKALDALRDKFKPFASRLANDQAGATTDTFSNPAPSS